MASHQFLIDKFLQARQTYGFGDQYDYFESTNHIGWTRPANEAGNAIAVLLSNAGEASQRMEVKLPNTEFVDSTGHIADSVTTGDDGWGDFRCNGGSVSVWVPK